jgi:hypothetical protein
MEMPIRIIITLFVVMVVGTTIIVFSKQMIDKAKGDIQTSTPGQKQSEIEDQKIIQLTTVDTQQLTDLITECYKKHHSATFERTLCFVVVAKEGAWKIDDVASYMNAKKDFIANVTFSDVNDNDYAMSIYFNPYGAADTIEISK